MKKSKKKDVRLSRSKAYVKLKKRRHVARAAIQKAYETEQILYTDKCILLNEIEHLFEINKQNIVAARLHKR